MSTPHPSRRLARMSPGALVGALLTLLALLTSGLFALTMGGADAAPPQTTTSVLRPVTAGAAAEGWSVKKLGVKVDCDGSSMAAVDDGIAGCYPTAASLRACWPSTDHTALCVQDPTEEQQLVRVRYRHAFPTVTAPAVPSPLTLHLADGQDCLLRIGGAWGAPKSHPNWIGHYSCTDGAVYAPPKSISGIDQRGPVWKVRLWDGTSDTLTRVRVVSATFVGNAE